MSGLTAILRADGVESDGQAVLECLNPLGNFVTKSWHSPSAFLAAAYPTESPTGHKSFYQGDSFVGLLAGDIVNADSLDWDDLRQSFAASAGLPAALRALRGTFVLAIYDLNNEIFWIATDSFGLHSLYFRLTRNAAFFSTSISSFLRASDVSTTWSENWLYHYLFFNYPLGDVSLLKNVCRVPAGMVGKFVAKTGQLEWVQYAEPISRSRRTYTGQSAVDKSISVFESIVPDWFDIKGRVVFGLSNGLDSRAVLAALPDSARSRIETFTYGIPGSTEIVEARDIAAALDLHHNEIVLDGNFLRQLPGLVHDTVFLSDAQQVINRSNLAYVYAALSGGGRPCAAIITGVSGDHLFRDHITAWGNVPYLISADMASMFRNGRTRISREFYATLFGVKFADFEEQIEVALDKLAQTYGEFTDPEAYFRYLMYVAGPQYFGGQAAIANAYSTFRTPYWDRNLVQLAMDIDLSTLGFSRKLSKKDKYLEAVLQASVVARNHSFRNIPYLDLPINVYSRNNRTRFQLHRLSRKIKSIVYGKRRIQEEDWPLWYRTAMSEEVPRLLGKDSVIKELVSDKFIQQQIAANDIHWLGKLMTAEIALRLVENGWQRRPAE